MANETIATGLTQEFKGISRDRITLFREEYLSYLKQFGNECIWFLPVNGNAGDALINYSVYSALRESGRTFNIASGPSSIPPASLVLYPGAGAFHLELTGARNVVNSLVSKSCRIIIGPASPFDVRYLASLPKTTVFSRHCEETGIFFKSCDAAFWLFDLPWRAPFAHLRPIHFLLFIRHLVVFGYVLSRSWIGRASHFRDDLESANKTSFGASSNVDISLLFGSRVTDPFGFFLSTAFFLLCIRCLRGDVLTDRLHVVIGSILCGKPVRYQDTKDRKIERCIKHVLR